MDKKTALEVAIAGLIISAGYLAFVFSGIIFIK